MSLSKEQVLHIAKLARLELSEAEVAKFQSQLSAILEYVSQLQKVDTTKVEPIAQISGLKNVMREDKMETGDKKTQEAILKQAPKRKGDFIETLGVFD